MALDFSKVFIELKILTDKGVSVGIKLTDMGSIFPVGVVDLSVSDFDFRSVPTNDFSLE